VTADFRWQEGELRFAIRTDDRPDDASVKTDESERFLTIHSAIRDEVWAHVEQRRAAGKTELFDLSAKVATTRMGRWLRKIDGLNLDARQTFYSLRHNVVTEFEGMANRREITESLAAYLTGHSTGQTVRAKKYIHRKVKEVAAAIEALPNPFAPVLVEAA